jgi:methanogenic corrinoid protein MtbC1
MSNLCGWRGFAGSSACILKRGHEGDHSYGNYLETVVREDMEEKETLRQQLSDHIKREVMLRDAVSFAISIIGHPEDDGTKYLQEILADTTDLEGLIVCDKKAVIETLSFVTAANAVYVRALDEKIGPNTKLYRAREPKS